MQIVHRRNRLSASILALLMMLPGCGEESAPLLTDPSADHTATGANSYVETVVPAEDQSLTGEEYSRRGLPAWDRAWSGEDMQRAWRVLKQIADENPLRLPRFQSPKSGEIFARMIAAENSNPLKDPSLSVQKKMEIVVPLLTANAEILKLYGLAQARGITFDSEFVELIGTNFDLFEITLTVIEEFIPTLDPNDPTYSVRMGGLRKMRSGLVTSISGCLQIVTESDEYRLTERQKLVVYLRRSLPGILPHLDDAQRKTIADRLEKMRTDSTLEQLQPGLSQLAEEVSAIVERSDSKTDADAGP